MRGCRTEGDFAAQVGDVGLRDRSSLLSQRRPGTEAGTMTRSAMPVSNSPLNNMVSSTLDSES